MGFDLSGVNPKMNMEPEELPVYYKYKSMEYRERSNILDNDKELRDKYWEEYDEYQDANPGIYFRNSCWGWRPLWSYVCEQFPDILDDDDMERGSYNDGHLIDEDKAMRIGVGLTAMLEGGDVQAYHDRYKAEIDALEQVECELCEGTGKRQEPPNSGAGDYPCNGCGSTGKKDDWAKSYPFNVENVEQFATFCLESGGFEIC
mgnify:CR=1 FL=1